MQPAIVINQDAIFKGDTWPGFPSLILRINDAVPASTIASAELVFFEAEKGLRDTDLKLESPADITIVSAEEWEVEVPAKILDLETGEWTFRLTIIDATGYRRTYATGTIQIL